MKAGFLQFCPVFGAKQHNLARIKTLLHGTVADLIVLPELCSTGYLFSDWDELEGLAEGLDGPTTLFMGSLAREMNCAFAYGFAEAWGSTIYNSVALVSPEGMLGVYRKVHLFMDEKSLFTAGNEGFSILAYGGVNYGMMICFDWIFPEAARTLALKGAQVILHPANLVLPHCPDAMVTRAIENRVFIITANRTGSEEKTGKEWRFIGQSQVIAPDGKILVRAQEEECVKIIDIDPVRANDKNITPSNNLFEDRKPGLYGC
jgi:predicted amidohydrolase